MVKIILKNMYNKEVTYSSAQHTVLHILQQNYIDWMHACGAKGRCTTCKFNVVSGAQYLSEPTDPELKYFKTARLKESERLSCQTQLLRGELEIETPEEYKLPHVKYSY